MNKSFCDRKFQKQNSLEGKGEKLSSLIKLKSIISTTKRKLKNPKNGLRGQTWLLVGLSVKPSAMSLCVKKRVLTGRFLLCL